MKKINLGITGCMGRMGQQLIKSSKINHNFMLKSLTENRLINKKFKLISSFAMFYDIDDPNKFCKDIKSLLEKNSSVAVVRSSSVKSLPNVILATACT